jgi:branched-chain amino acid transport system substrate-binding protein
MSVRPGPGNARQAAIVPGPLGHYGLDLEKGLWLGLELQNTAGGVAGRRIELLVRDDGGSRERAVANTQALLLDTGVLALTGFHGASLIQAVLPADREERGAADRHG